MTTTRTDDFDALMRILSVPRPNGDPALNTTRSALSEWLTAHGVHHKIHKFRIYPYFVEIGGLWLIGSQLLLVLSVWLRWGWPSLLLTIVSWLVVIVEANGIALLSRLVSDTGENIVVEFSPRDTASRELILSAHYDSKTELLNDRARNFFMGKLPLAILLALIIGVLGLVDGFIRQIAGFWASIPYFLALFLTIPLLALVLPLGINFVFGRYAPPSEGAVDNGAGCAILLDIANRFQHGEIRLDKTKVTIVLFCGEEVVVQGSRAYVRDRDFPYPTQAVNLELMGQDGGYVIWRKVGSPFQAHQTDPALNQRLSETIATLTDAQLVSFGGPAGTDSLPFAAAGIPATSLASRDSELGFNGFHTPQDNRGRVVGQKLVEGVTIIQSLIIQTDDAEMAS